MSGGTTTREERNLATAEALYAATGSDDWQSAGAMLSDDLVITEADTLPYAGTYRGKGALRELYAKVLSSSLGGAAIEVTGRAAGGDDVVYLLRLVPPGAGAPYYFDSDAVNRACGGVGAAVASR